MAVLEKNSGKNELIRLTVTINTKFLKNFPAKKERKSNKFAKI